MRREEERMMKITRPRPKPTYLRTELFGLLDELIRIPLILVNGMPGSGRTTLISSYIESRNIPCLWYQVDREDEDLAVFLNYLKIATFKLISNFKIKLPQVLTGRSFSIDSQAREYFTTLYKYLGSHFMIVLDDFHKLPEEAPLRDLIEDACAVLPQGGQIVLINNSDCHLDLDHLRAQHMIATLDSEELQLNPKEVKQISEMHGVRLPSDHEAEQLLEKVDGSVGVLVQELKTDYQQLATQDLMIL